MTQRLIVILIILPVGVFAAVAGGWVLAALVLLLLGLGAWEYWRLFTRGGYRPSGLVLVGGVISLAVARQLFEFQGSELLLGLLVLLAMAVQVFAYEKGSQSAALDFNITVGGIMYLGWLGSYLISLRGLPDGLWWFMLVLPSIWISDGAAYLVGRKLGKHKMNKRVSPNKSWEGYVGGVVAGALGAMLLASLWHLRAPDVTPMKGLILGFIVSVLSPLGDLGESMLKRAFGVKDTSNIFPGHGGVMDRIDSWLWAGIIGYYLILYAWI